MAVIDLRNRMIDFMFEDKVTTEFFIDKDKRTIACVITTRNDVPLRLAKYGLADEKYDDEDYDIRIYKGIAKCAPDDEWNAAFGMQLAEYRASRARQTDVNKELRKYIKNITKCVDDLRTYGLLKDPHLPNEKKE